MNAGPVPSLLSEPQVGIICMIVPIFFFWIVLQIALNVMVYDLNIKECVFRLTDSHPRASQLMTFNK